MYVGDLEGDDLNYWVARAQGHDSSIAKIFVRGTFAPSEDWEQGGPILERALIQLRPSSTGLPGWTAVGPQGGRKSEHIGRTPLVAAMRCYVAMKLGNEVSD